MDWDERYMTHGRCFGDAPNAFTVDAVERVEARRGQGLALFFPGDGYGRCGLWAAARGHTVIATDVSRVAVDMAMGQATAMGLDDASTLCADDGTSTSLPIPPFADACVISWVRVENDSTGERQRRWNRHCAHAVHDAGSIALVTSSRLTTPEREQAAWPNDIDWQPAEITGHAITMMGTVRRSG